MDGLPPGHGDRPDAGPTGALSRRTFVGTAAAAGLAIGLAPAGFASSAAASRRRNRLRRQPFARAGAFDWGVASGLPNQRGITLWTRVGDLGTSSFVGLEVASDPDFRRVVHRERVRSAEIRDFTVHKRLVGRRLRPDTPYWYRFHTRTTASPVGRFKTAKPPDSREPVRIGYFSCQEWNSGYYTAHAGLAAEEDLDLVVCAGDYIYERAFYEGPRQDTLGPNGDGEVQSLPEYREKYRLYRSDPNLQAMHAAHPFVAIWDDHEIEDNWAADQPGHATLDQRVPFLDRRRNAYNAFFEYMPQPRISSDRDRIYRTMRLGANAQIFLQDQRAYRDVQPCDDQFLVPCGELDDPRTMLGEAQKVWFTEGLRASPARWKLVMSQVMWMALDLPQNNAINKDQWDGYNNERNQILNFIRDNRIDNVSFITGDIHTFFAGEVHHDGRRRLNSAPPVATEFVPSSISSLGVAELFGLQSLPNEITQALGDAVLMNLANPHYAYTDVNRRGYGVIEARPDELEIAFRSPVTTQAEESAIQTIARFRVPSGVPRVETVSALDRPGAAVRGG